MTNVAKKVARHRLLRSAVMVAVVVPAALFAGCAPQPAPPPPPVAYQPPATASGPAAATSGSGCRRTGLVSWAR